MISQLITKISSIVLLFAASVALASTPQQNSKYKTVFGKSSQKVNNEYQASVNSTPQHSRKYKVVFDKSGRELDGQAGKHDSEYHAVVNALQPYIQGARSGNGEHMDKAFYDHAKITGSIDGEFSSLDTTTFKNRINEQGEAPDADHRIAWIDISGPAAAAKIEFTNWRGRKSTDFFVLYKHQGEWKISGKVYDAES
ncbi:nuclear transport factor 2 family protein [Agarilytica rhodophyticola]|uniref:nuclear transport factor 2 family protein n=1 Tax=Agarilytica rhodophyticola TaxID=1737490 RepID=UPI000B347D34|nr:nuclear transport factor 2 family protein [Agarilytica rhodophyticola]